MKHFVLKSVSIVLLGSCVALGGDDFATSLKRTPMRFDPQLNAQAPLQLVFNDEDGKPVELARLFQQKPVILNLVYFNCPMMCTLVLNGLVRSMKQMPLLLGKDYTVVTLSIDAREKPPLAQAKKKLYMERYRRPGTESGWSFLTGEAASIQSLADAVGFQYKYYPDLDQFDHPLGIIILTPAGRVVRYLYGDRFKPKELRAALLQAASQPAR